MGFDDIKNSLKIRKNKVIDGLCLFDLDDGTKVKQYFPVTLYKV